MLDFAAFRIKFFELVDDSESIVITSHLSPDDDSIGSVLAMRAFLTKKYPEKNIRILYSGEAPTRFKQVQNFETIYFVSDVASEIKKHDLVIFLDASQYARFSKLPDQLREKIERSICIDHHASVVEDFTLALVVPEFSSNAELIYQAVIGKDNLTKDTAAPLLMGILGDTGNFAYVPPTQSQVFIIAKDLIEIVGESIDSFRARYGGIPAGVFPLLQELMKNTSYGALSGWPDFQYSYIDRAVMLEGNFNDEDMSAASHIYMGQYLPRMQGYGWGFVITPRSDGSFRMSSRSSSGSVNVRNLHERMGIGSGHDKASGGAFLKGTQESVETCISFVVEWMKSNTPAML